MRSLLRVPGRSRLVTLGALLALVAGGAPGLARADDTVSALEKSYHDSRDDDTRRRALVALGELKSPDAERVLALALAQDPSEPVRLEAVAALLKHGDEAAAKALLSAVSAFDPFVSEAVIAGLSQGMPDKFKKWLLDSGVANERPEIRAAALRILAATHAPELGSRLGKLANDSALEVREAVGLALGKVDAKIALPIADRLTRDAEVRVRVAALAALASFEGEKPEKLLATAADSDRAWQARLEAVRALGERAPKKSLDLLLRTLRDLKADHHVRLAALEAVSHQREIAVLDALVAVVSDGGDRFDSDARRALATLMGREIGTADDVRAFWKDHKAAFQFPEANPATPPPAFALRTQSRFFDLPIDSLRPCFVLDVSGSMSESMPVSSGTVSSAAAIALTTKITVARAELKRALESLPKGASFGVILFSDRMIPIQDQPIAATKESIAKVLSDVANYAPQGSTNLYGALANLFHGSSPRDPAAADAVAFDTIYLLSDGLPTSGAVTGTAALRERVRDFNRFAKVRIHAVGIGDENRELLEGLAHDAGGQYVQR